MATYEEVRAKLTNTQLNKIKSAAKNNAGTTFRILKKNFQDKELLHELFLTTNPKTKIRNAFANNMLMDIKLSKAQISKIIQLGGCLTGVISNLGKFGKSLKKHKQRLLFLLQKMFCQD